MWPPRMTGIIAVAAAIGAMLLGGCKHRGFVSFIIEDPRGGPPDVQDKLSPFFGSRAASLALFDERQSPPVPIGSAVPALLESGPFSEVPVGDHDFRLNVTGGGVLLGVARAHGISVQPGEAKEVLLRLRKPLLFYSSEAAHVLSITDTVFPLMGIDTTAPAVVAMPGLGLAGCSNTPDSCPGATASTADGRYLLLAVTGRLVALDTGVLYADAGPIAGTVILASLPGNPAPPLPRAMAISPDGSTVAVVTRQGLNIAPLATVLASSPSSPSTIPTIEIDGPMGNDNARALAWMPDSSAVTVLAGPWWSDISGTFCQNPQPAQVSDVRPDGTRLETRAAPSSATDLAYGPDGRLLFAAPCGGGVITAAGEPVIAGKNIARMVVAAGQVVAIPGTLTDDGAGHLMACIRTSGAAAPVPDGGAGECPSSFEVKSDEIPFRFLDGHELRFAVAPAANDFLVYDMALSPDGTSLAIASRAQYQTDTDNKLLTDQSCTYRLSVTRELYRVTQVDRLTGFVEYEVEKGTRQATPCVINCCSMDNPPMCTPSTARCDLDPATGFTPWGLSILFGNR